MFNRHDEQHNQHNHTYQAVNINVPAYQSGSTTASLAGIAMFGMLVILLAGIAVVLYRLITDTVALLAGVVVALLSAVVTLIPWLVGGAVLVALAMVAARALPDAIDEVQDIRYRLSERRQRLLECQNATNRVLDVRPVRVSVDAEL